MPKNILVSACLLGVNCRYNAVEKANEAVLKLLDRNDLVLIPVCPEQLGGLATPRVPSEITSDRCVRTKDGRDVTAAYQCGAREALKLAKLYHCQTAILKERSPSCGCGEIYDGTFTGTLTAGDGITAELLKQNAIEVIGETRVSDLLKN